MKLFKKKKLLVALINEHGKVLEKPMRCPCNNKTSFIDSKTVHCRRCGTWDIKELLQALLIEYSPQFTFIESN